MEPITELRYRPFILSYGGKLPEDARIPDMSTGRVVVLNDRAALVLGADPDDEDNDLLLVCLIRRHPNGSISCKRLSPDNPSENPPSCQYFSACLQGDHVYIFGGEATMNACFDDGKSYGRVMYRVDLSAIDASNGVDVDKAPALIWQKIPTASQKPPARINASMCALDGTRIALFGGVSKDEEPLDDLWVFDLVRNSWSLIKQRQGDAPSGRQSAMISCYNGSIYICGGRDRSLELWKASFEDQNAISWTRYGGSSPVSPSDRECASFDVVGDSNMLLFGGFEFTEETDESPSRYAQQRDLLWLYNLPTNAWIPLKIRNVSSQWNRDLIMRGSYHCQRSHQTTIITQASAEEPSQLIWMSLSQATISTESDFEVLDLTPSQQNINDMRVAYNNPILYDLVAQIQFDGAASRIFLQQSVLRKRFEFFTRVLVGGAETANRRSEQDGGVLFYSNPESQLALLLPFTQHVFDVSDIRHLAAHHMDDILVIMQHAEALLLSNVMKSLAVEFANFIVDHNNYPLEARINNNIFNELFQSTEPTEVETTIFETLKQHDDGWDLALSYFQRMLQRKRTFDWRSKEILFSLKQLVSSAVQYCQTELGTASEMLSLFLDIGARLWTIPYRSGSLLFFESAAPIAQRRAIPLHVGRILIENAVDVMKHPFGGSDSRLAVYYYTELLAACLRCPESDRLQLTELAIQKASEATELGSLLGYMVVIPTEDKLLYFSDTIYSKFRLLPADCVKIIRNWLGCFGNTSLHLQTTVVPILYFITMASFKKTRTRPEFRAVCEDVRSAMNNASVRFFPELLDKGTFPAKYFQFVCNLGSPEELSKQIGACLALGRLDYAGAEILIKALCGRLSTDEFSRQTFRKQLPQDVERLVPRILFDHMQKFPNVNVARLILSLVEQRFIASISSKKSWKHFVAVSLIVTGMANNPPPYLANFSINEQLLVHLVVDMLLRCDSWAENSEESLRHLEALGSWIVTAGLQCVGVPKSLWNCTDPESFIKIAAFPNGIIDHCLRQLMPTDVLNKYYPQGGPFYTIERSAPTIKRAAENFTLFHHVAKRNREEWAKILIERGAKPSLKAAVESAGNRLDCSEVAEYFGHKQLSLMLRTHIIASGDFPLSFYRACLSPLQFGLPAAPNRDRDSTQPTFPK